jgi:CubicO group peptidase (beta-lactamase class C family)
MKRPLFSLCCWIASTALFAQTPANRFHRIEAALPVIEKIYRDYAAQRNIPGIAFGIVVDGNLLYANGIGVADLPSASTTCLPTRRASPKTTPGATANWLTLRPN